MTSPLELRGVTKHFDDVGAVNGVDLTLADREILALVGPSGCGKSTMLRMIAGLVPVDSGTIRLDGVLVDDGTNRLPPERRPAGLVFQEHALFPHLTVHDNVAFGVRGKSRSATSAKVAEMLELVQLGEYGDRFPHELSGGERQRVALARALAPEPALMLFDEPFASLDHNLRVRLRHHVTAALRATGTPAVFVTHDQREALAIGDRIAVMRGGRIRQLATPSDVFHTPADTFVGAFMGEASFLQLDGHRSALGHVPHSFDDDAVAMVRPHDVHFVQDPRGTAEIIGLEYHGESWLATALLSSGDEVMIAASHLESPTVGMRGEVRLHDGHEQVAVRR